MAGTNIGKAYVQIVPSADGIQGSITNLLGGESSRAGLFAGKNIGGKIISAIAAAGIGTAIVSTVKSAINEGAALEQSIGGVQTLFGDAAESIQKYANSAYQYGISANTYMEQSTSFAASLTKALGGDVTKAAEYANMAIEDMADNAAKMGTDVESLQNAYQGLAKGNATMLDNLKIGYGGTSTEMLKLAKDMGVVDESIQSFNDMSFDQAILAIHKMQEELGVSGVAIDEAKTTFSGSLEAMKASWQNVLGNLMIGDDLTTALQGLTDTAVTFVNDNLLPAIQNVLGNLPTMLSSIVTNIAPVLLPELANTVLEIAQSLVTELPTILSAVLSALTQVISTIASALPSLIPTIVNVVIQLTQTLIDNLPMILDAALQLIQGLADGLIAALPVLIDALPAIIEGIVDFLSNAIPQIIETGISLLSSLIQGMPQIIESIIMALPEIVLGIIAALNNMIPQLVQCGTDLLVSLVEDMPAICESIVSRLPNIITSILQALANNIPKIAMAGVQLLVALVQRLPQIISSVVKAIPQIITAIVNAVGQGVSKMAEAGTNLVKGLFNGISNAVSWLYGKLQGWVSSVLSYIKGLFGIASPSKKTAVFGRFLDEGIGVGLLKNLNIVNTASETVASSVLDVFDNMSDGITSTFNAAFTSSADHITASVHALTVDSANAMANAIDQINDANMDDAMKKASVRAYTMMNVNGDAAKKEADEKEEMNEKLDCMIELLTRFFPELLNGMDRQLVLDTGVIAGAVTPYVDTTLGRTIKHRERGN